MESLKYKVIKSKWQYRQYCQQLESLITSHKKGKSTQDEIELLTLLIEKWDQEHQSFTALDPIQLLHCLMDDHNMKAKDMVALLGVSKGYVSEILHYRKGLSKDVIRKLSDHFKLAQEAFNREYPIKGYELSVGR